MSAPPAAPDRAVPRRRRLLAGALSSGYPRSFAIGSTFSIAWSPCIGPILGVVLTLAATSGTAGQGAVLLLFYSLGLGVWFLAMGLFFGWLSPRLRRVQRHTGKLLLASAAIFVVVGALMVLGEFQRLNNYFASLGFFFDQTASAEDGLREGVRGVFGPWIAFFGGLVSFLSPCVLPLVPAYLANLAGESVLGSGSPSASERRRLALHAVAFVAGFTLVFMVLGASAGFAGSLLLRHLDLLTRIGGVVLIVLGLQMSGLIRIPFLERTYQIRVS